MDEEKQNELENGQNNNQDKKLADFAKDVGRKQAKAAGKVVKAVMGKIMVVLGALLVKLIPVLVVMVLLYTAVNWVLELIKSDNTSAIIYETLEIESLADLIEIKGDEANGYYLDFSEGTDKKLEEIVEKFKIQSGVQSFSDVELLKKMIMAEVSSQFPNLGGEIPAGSDGFQGGIKIRRVTPNKEPGEMKNTGAGEVLSVEKLGTSVNETQTSENGNVYTVGVMAAHSTDSPGGRSPESEENELKAEEMTILVSRYVQKLLSIYENVKVVELGSTVENPNVSDSGRLQSAVDANVDILIEIDFATSGTGKELNNYNGVTAVYNKKGTTDSGVEIAKGSSSESHKLGQILRENVASKMNLLNNQSSYNEPSETIGTSDNNFPSVTIRGGYLTGDKDYQILSEEECLIDYARGLVDGILEYFSIENKGYGTVTLSEETITNTVNSNVYDLKYVTEDKFNEYIQNNDRQVLHVYTLSENNTKLLTAKWKVEGSTVTIEKNIAMDYRKSMEMYTMPYEYLIAMLIDTKTESFVEGLADMAIGSEYIIAVQDKVTTRTTTTETYESTDGGNQVMIAQDGPNLIETVSSSLSLTYADAWFVKFYNDVSFSTEYLNTILTDTHVDRNTLINIENINLDGRVSETSPDPTWIPVGTRNEIEYMDDGSVRNHTIVTTTATRTHSISNTYSTGSKNTEGKEYDFIKLYQGNEEVQARIKPAWLFTILERNDKTKNMVDLTKYLLYKASGVNYGIKTFDFSKYNLADFNSTKVNGSSVGHEWTKTFENDTLRKYLNGTITDYNYSPYIYMCVTEDKTKYIMCDDLFTGNGNRNYGFGVCFYTPYGVGWMSVERFARHGIDIKAPEYNIYGQSTIDVEIVDAVSHEIYLDKRQEVINAANEIGVELEEYQIDCLTDFRYRGDLINGVLTAYKEYGLNESVLKGYYGFNYGRRGELRWKLFSEGIYETKAGEILDPGNYVGNSGSSYAEQGDGYSQLYTNSHGRTFKEYKQYEGSYKNNRIWSGDTISSSGCMITSVAILVSGYGSDLTPADTNNIMNQVNRVSETTRRALPAGIPRTEGTSYWINQETLRNHLLAGGTAWFDVGPGIFTGSTHFMAILDISSDGSQVYISNPGAANSSALSGWMDMSVVYGGNPQSFFLIGP